MAGINHVALLHELREMGFAKYVRQSSEVANRIATLVREHRNEIKDDIMKNNLWLEDNDKFALKVKSSFYHSLAEMDNFNTVLGKHMFPALRVDISFDPEYPIGLVLWYPGSTSGSICGIHHFIWGIVKTKMTESDLHFKELAKAQAYLDEAYYKYVQGRATLLTYEVDVEKIFIEDSGWRLDRVWKLPVK